jgi:hypothetical protein
VFTTEAQRAQRAQVGIAGLTAEKKGHEKNVLAVLRAFVFFVFCQFRFSASDPDVPANDPSVPAAPLW